MIEKLFQRPPDVVRRSIIHKTSYNRMIETKMYSGETLDAPACMCESLSVWTWIVQEEPCAKLWLFESDFRVLASKRTVPIVACIVTCDREFAVVSVATRHWDGDYAKRTRNLFYRSVRVSLSQSSSPWRPPLSARCQKQDSFPKLNRTKVVSLSLSVSVSRLSLSRSVCIDMKLGNKDNTDYAGRKYFQNLHISTATDGNLRMLLLDN